MCSVNTDIFDIALITLVEVFTYQSAAERLCCKFCKYPAQGIIELL